MITPTMIHFLFSFLLIWLAAPCHAMTIKPTPPPTFDQGMVSTSLGQVHYRAVGLDSAGFLLPVVGFHMSPRSSDEYREIMEECSSKESGRLFVALDQLGFGQSSNPTRSCTLDEMADSFAAVLDELKIKKCVVVGSLTPGCCLALSLASRYPQRVEGVVCCNLYHFPAEAREQAFQEENQRLEASEIEDEWKLQDDGRHVKGIWDRRNNVLTNELNTRVTLDEFQYLVKRRERYAQGIHIQEAGTFPLPNACWNTLCPVLCINGKDAVDFVESKGLPFTQQFQEAMVCFSTAPEVVSMPGAGVHMLNENAEEWWKIVRLFCGNIEAARNPEQQLPQQPQVRSMQEQEQQRQFEAQREAQRRGQFAHPPTYPPQW